MPIVRQILPAALAFFLAFGAAHAGEFAEFRPIGFSSDGKVFAFEEFGVQDGSGFPFANRFFIDTTSDAFLPGSTVRVTIEDEAATVGDARAEAHARSQALESTHDFASNPGTLAAFNPLSEVSGAAHELRYTPISMEPQPFDPYTVRLAEKQLPSSSGCEPFGDTTTGFRLALTEVNGQATDIVLHDDASVPASRQCPSGYRIGGVVTHYADGVMTHAVLVLVRSFGFEGENGRWIAVTRRLE